MPARLAKTSDVEMREAADPGAGVADLAGVLLRVRDQLRHRLRFEILRGGEEEGRIDREAGHRHHVLLEVDGELLLEQDRGDGIGRDVADHQRVAVRLGAGHFLDGENAEGARLALDHELLAEALPHLLAEQARGDVGGAAGSIGHDDLHRLRGIFVLRPGGDGRMQDTAAPDPNRSVSSHPPGELAEIATPTGIGSLSIVVQARRLKQAIDRAMLSRRGQIAAQSSPLAKPFAGGGRQAALTPCRLWDASLHVKKTTSALGRGLAGMHDIGRECRPPSRTWPRSPVADLRPERALQNVNPLLVRMRMRLRAGAGGHPHQPDDHAVALDAGAVGGRIVGAAEDVVHLGEIEQVFAFARALGTGGTRNSSMLSHVRLLRFFCLLMPKLLPGRQANARADVLSPAAPSSARARPPRMADWSAGRNRQAANLRHALRHAHVEGIVAAEQHAVGARFADEEFEHVLRMHDGIEIEALERIGRRLRQPASSAPCARASRARSVRPGRERIRRHARGRFSATDGARARR